VKPMRLSPLQIAIGVSLAVHAVLLTIRLVDPQAFNRVFQDTPLEVVLVNAKSHDKPAQAQAIAQANLAGGGQADSGRASTPLPPSVTMETGDSSEETRQRALQDLQEQQNIMLSQVHRQLAAMEERDLKPLGTALSKEAAEEKRRQLTQLLAEIERRINSENARPKKRYVSPATREEAYAVYYDKLRRSIEDRGTRHFPEVAGKKLYGELTMIVTVNFDGQILDTRVVDSSGSYTLDRRAEAIARSSGPFGRFTDAMRRQADQILVVSRFRFSRDETLQARPAAQ